MNETAIKIKLMTARFCETNERTKEVQVSARNNNENIYKNLL